MDGTDLIAALRGAGHEPYGYSGRCMYGRRCVAVDLGSVREIFSLGHSLGGSGADDPGPPAVDSMGLGVVAYWPHVAWPEGPHPDGSSRDEDEEEEDGHAPGN